MSDSQQAPSAPGSEPSAVVRMTSYKPILMLRLEVADAKRLLDFAIANGKAVSNDVIAGIKKAEIWLLPDWPNEQLPKDEERVAFEQCYRDLASLMTPVTAATLRSTSDASEDGERAFPWAWRRPASEAKVWSRKLWAWTSVTALVILFSTNMTEILAQFYPADIESRGASQTWQIINIIVQSIEPFAYGALGAFAYLLRSAHMYIYERSFDSRRKPEYWNRVLLGMISGGAIKLFVTNVTTDAGEVIELSGAALAFIAGYNSDFLFTTIERVIAAILPKVGVESVRRQAPDRMALMTVERLVSRYASAGDSEKKMIERLVDKLTGPQG